jgi:hypothetical protein
MIGETKGPRKWPGFPSGSQISRSSKAPYSRSETLWLEIWARSSQALRRRETEGRDKGPG